MKPANNHIAEDAKGASTPTRRRVVVAMSGGVDSSVVAALMKSAGHDVIGITLQLYDHGEASAKPGSCCAGQDIHDARRVAEQLEIPHYVLDYESRFAERVIEEFADSYVSGETPIPCVTCNSDIKFGDLLAKMSPDLLAHEKRLWGVIGSFNLPEDNQHRIEQMIQQMATQSEQLHDLLPLSERFVELAELPEDAPEVVQLVEAYVENFKKLGLTEMFDADEASETTILHETMNKLAMASLAPAQARFFQHLSDLVTETLHPKEKEGETTHAAK